MPGIRQGYNYFTDVSIAPQTEDIVAGHKALYTKSDGLYMKDSTGVEVKLASSSDISGSLLNFQQGAQALTTSNYVYSVSHNNISVDDTKVLVNVRIPSSTSVLYTASVRNRTATSFEIVLSDTPNEVGYFVDWIIIGNGVMGSTVTVTGSDIEDVLGTGSRDITAMYNFVPNVSGGFDLGSPTKPWRDLYLTNNSLHLGGVKLSTLNNELKVENKFVVTSSVVSDLSGYATISYVEGASGNLQSQINNKADTSLLSTYATVESLQATATNLQSQINNITGGSSTVGITALEVINENVIVKMGYPEIGLSSNPIIYTRSLTSPTSSTLYNTPISIVYSEFDINNDLWYNYSEINLETGEFNFNTPLTINSGIHINNSSSNIVSITGGTYGTSIDNSKIEVRNLISTENVLIEPTSINIRTHDTSTGYQLTLSTNTISLTDNISGTSAILSAESYYDVDDSIVSSRLSLGKATASKLTIGGLSYDDTAYMNSSINTSTILLGGGYRLKANSVGILSAYYEVVNNTQGVITHIATKNDGVSTSYDNILSFTTDRPETHAVIGNFNSNNDLDGIEEKLRVLGKTAIYSDGNGTVGTPSVSGYSQGFINNNANVYYEVQVGSFAGDIANTNRTSQDGDIVYVI